MIGLEACGLAPALAGAETGAVVVDKRFLRGV
jgi:hypothetical protein